MKLSHFLSFYLFQLVLISRAQVIPNELNAVIPSLFDTQNTTGCAEAATWAQDWTAWEMKWLFIQYTRPIAVPVGVLQGGCGCYRQTSNLWHHVIALEGVVNYMTQFNSSQYTSRILKSKPAMVDGANNFLFGPAAFSNSHDDALWTALLYIRITEWLEAIGEPDERYWNAAVKLVDWAGEGRNDARGNPAASDSCDDGVWWEDSHSKNPPYKNTITNALYIYASMRLYFRTNDQQRLDDAKGSWDFVVRAGLRRPPTDKYGNLFSDGTMLPDCKSNNLPVWTYNQGVLISALGLLFRATGNQTYLNEATLTIDAVQEHMTVNGVLAESYCEVDQPPCDINAVGFKGLFMRHLSYFLSSVGLSLNSTTQARYAVFITTSALAIKNNALQSNGDIASVWFASGVKDVTIGGSVNVFSSGVDAALAAAQHGSC